MLSRITLDTPGASRWDRALTFFSHFDCRVYLARDAYVDVGAGSLEMVRKIEVVPVEHKGSLGTIGRYCETAQCTIMAAGEHSNALPVNMWFGALPVIRKVIQDRSGVAPTPMIDIGNAVLISRGAMVLSGVSVGDGAVIGANAVLTKPAEPFGIYAGVPARKLKDRMSPEVVARVRQVAWWMFDPAYLGANGDDLQALAVSDGPHVYSQPGRRVVLTIADGLTKTRVLGTISEAGSRLLENCPDKVQSYVAQAFGDGPYEWLADIWSA